jgi:hypothetical protein
VLAGRKVGMLDAAAAAALVVVLRSCARLAEVVGS